MSHYLSYLMGAHKIENKDLTDLDISIEKTIADGDRTLKIPEEKISQYIELIKAKLDSGFWNEVIGTKEIIFIFKFNGGSIKEYRLSRLKILLAKIAGKKIKIFFTHWWSLISLINNLNILIWFFAQKINVELWVCIF